MGTKFTDGTTSGIAIADYGVWGDTSKGYGVAGTSAKSNGVYGESSNSTGVYGRSDKPGEFQDPGTNVLGGNGVFGENNQIIGIGVRANAGGQNGIGVYSTSAGTGVFATGGDGGVVGTSQSQDGVHGNSISGSGVSGISTTSDGVNGFSVSGVGVSGSGSSGFGVSGLSESNTGVLGQSNTGIGVNGLNENLVRIGNAPGVRGDGNAEDGVWAISQNGNGIYAVGGSKNSAYAAYLRGRVFIAGPLIKPGGSFRIDHPLDPANKYLHHSFVESPDMKNIYDGVATLNAQGEAEVELPEWFGALNHNFRYQLTAIGASGPSLHIAHEIDNNRFRIAGGAPRMKVSWQVTGVRVDAWAKAHRIQVEEDKPAEERGRYLHPELYNQPEERAVDWALRSAARAKPGTEKDPSKRPETLKRTLEFKEGEKNKLS